MYIVNAYAAYNWVFFFFLHNTFDSYDRIALGSIPTLPEDWTMILRYCILPRYLSVFTASMLNILTLGKSYILKPGVQEFGSTICKRIWIAREILSTPMRIFLSPVPFVPSGYY